MSRLVCKSTTWKLVPNIKVLIHSKMHTNHSFNWLNSIKTPHQVLKGFIVSYKFVFSETNCSGSELTKQYFPAKDFSLVGTLQKLPETVIYYSNILTRNSK